MKKLLYVTTALASVAVAGHAFAQAKPMAITVGGYFDQAFVAALDNNDGRGQGAVNTHGHAFYQSSEIHFTGRMTLDNGIRVGVRVELEGDSQADIIDEVWTDFQGGFGRVIFGQFDPAVREMGMFAPYGGRSDFSGLVENSFTQNGAAGLTGWMTTIQPVFGGDANKIVYFSPVFSGFQLGLSYMPNGAEYTDTRPTANFLPLANNGDRSHGFDAALTFKNKFGEIDVSAMLGFQSYDGEVGSTATINGVANAQIKDRQNGYSGGLQIGFAGFVVGGSFAATSVDIVTAAAPTTKVSGDRLVWDAGVSYQTGPWKVGVTYMNGSSEIDRIAQASPTAKNTRWGLSGSYLLGPGLTLEALLAHEESKNQRNNTITGVPGTEDATVLIVGSKVNF